MSDSFIEVDETVVARLKRTIIIQENKNLRTRDKNDQEMVKWIKGKIEEEVRIRLSQFDVGTSKIKTER